jgi:hypothetical protein
VLSKLEDIPASACCTQANEVLWRYVGPAFEGYIVLLTLNVFRKSSYCRWCAQLND